MLRRPTLVAARSIDLGVALRARPGRLGVRRRFLGPDGLDLMVGAGVACLVGAEVVSSAINVPSVATGAVLVLLQASGPVVVALATILLVGAHGHRRGVNAVRFWLASLLLCALTYVAWSAVYFLADGGWSRPLPAMGRQFAHDLLTGSARPQLGLVFVALQVCAVTPALRWVTRITRAAHARLLVGSLVLQVVAGTLLSRLPVPGLDPARLLPSFLFFVVAGALLVEHRDELGGWIGRYRGGAVACMVAAVAATELSYGIDLGWRHLTPERAAQPVQPGITIAGIGALAALCVAGVRWNARSHPRWQAGLVSAWSDTAAGIYLLAPAILQAALAATYLGGLIGRVPRMSEVKTVALELGCGVPLLLAVAWLLTSGLRRSPLSAVLTARPRRPPSPFAGARQVTLGAGAGMSGLAVVLAVALGAQLPLRLPVQPAQPRAEAQAPTPTPIAQTVTAAAPVAAATTANMHTITVGGMQRIYEVIQPQRPVSARLPVFVFLHGINADITAEEDRDGLLPLATDGQAILVYPQGSGNSWNLGTCCSAAYSNNADDLSFLADVVHLSAAISGANPALVYVVGYSDGGKMAYHLACEEPHLAAGFAIIAALPATACPPGPPVPLLQISGDNDPVNAYQLVVQQVSGWVTRDGCAAAHSTGTFGTLTLQTWSTCAQGSRVEFATYAGGGHGPFGGNGSPPLAQMLSSFAVDAPLAG